jgi:SAM-dependent methyltransferase
MNIFEWIQSELHPAACTSVEFMYDDMDSQSDYCLPIIYKRFNVADRSHWRDRGSCFDFLYATRSAGKKVLDFGPGDGWPSLIIAPYVQEVVGVDASQRRVEVCKENAARLGISNATFIHAAPGTSLPFEDETFDSIVAASSIEQTPEPYCTLQELYRVLRNGGRLRIDYEGLRRYLGGREQEVYVDDTGDEMSSLTLYDRDLEHETAVMCKICYSMNGDSLKRHFSNTIDTPVFADVTVAKLRLITDRVSDVRTCSLTHPSCATLVTWLDRIGFGDILPSYSGAWFAGQFYDVVSSAERPQDIQGVDDLVRPVVQIVVNMAASMDLDPMITAVK